MIKDSDKRSLLKAVSWRVVGTLDTMVLSFFITGQLKVAMYIGFTELLTKIVLYYLHERAWTYARWGKGTSGPTRLRSLSKSISWRTLGTIDTIILSYIYAKDIGNALTIGGTEVFTKIALYYLHERLWSRVRWGRISD